MKVHCPSDMAPGGIWGNGWKVSDLPLLVRTTIRNDRRTPWT